MVGADFTQAASLAQDCRVAAATAQDSGLAAREWNRAVSSAKFPGTADLLPWDEATSWAQGTRWTASETLTKNDSAGKCKFPLPAKVVFSPF